MTLAAPAYQRLPNGIAREMPLSYSNVLNPRYVYKLINNPLEFL